MPWSVPALHTRISPCQHATSPILHSAASPHLLPHLTSAPPPCSRPPSPHLTANPLCHCSPNPAANLLKPMLARGELRLIGATTLTEYREHVEKDAAFERRFQQVGGSSAHL